MEFFHGVNVDWMGKTKYFVALSLLLLVAGWISILHRVSKNPEALYGIDFRGGTLVYVRFAGKPPIDQIRTGLQASRPAEQHHSRHQRHAECRLAE